MSYIENFHNELAEGTVIDVTFNWEYPNIKIPEGFLEWFLSNGKCFERYSDEKSIFNQYENNKSTNNQCFQNAQLFSFKNTNIGYYEGFVYGAKYKMTFHHGFNVIDNKAIDITDFYNNIFKKETESNWYKESIILYYGVHIPTEFIEKYKKNLESSTIHNPIILDYYYETKI